MQPDDEIVFGRSLDESRACAERIEAPDRERTIDLTFTRAELELHGATLRSLAKWYPDEPRVQRAVTEWETLAARV
jgi:hypothetical protein